MSYFLNCVAACILGVSITFASGCGSERIDASAQRSKARSEASPDSRSLTLTELPGGGLKQHSFLYCGGGDTRTRREQSIFIVKDGKVAWQYSIPTQDGHDDPNEFSDVHLLSNGNIV